MRHRPLLAAIVVVGVVFGGVPGAAAQPGAVQPPDPAGRDAAPPVEIVETNRRVVEFAPRADVDAARSIDDFSARGEAVVDALRETADDSQAAAAEVARDMGGTVDRFWIRNVMVVEGLGDDELAELESLPGVTEIRPERIYPLVVPVSRQEAVFAATGDPEWGVSQVGADQVWETGVTGAGVVVATIDTGADFGHPALVDQYRGNLGNGSFSHDYNWWDPTGICGDTPCDNAEHGTHVLGTIVGGDGPGPFTPDIGVAPGATWIAAKGCEDLGCSESALMSSGQWMLAPTDLAGENPDPSKRPDIVNNSWGGFPGDEFYLETVQSWRAAGIIPVFASGNPGPVCGEGGSPADYLESFSIGATDADDLVAEFSGRGPSVFGKINPDVVAPGVDITSAVPGGYATFSGTSQATPHVTGALALVMSSTPDLFGDFDGATSSLTGTAIDILDPTCGGDEDGDPNNVSGEGRVDAFAAVQLVATGGTLVGTVTDDATSEPVPGARVTAGDGRRDFTAFTGDDGTYRLFLAAGTYTVSAVGFGYETAVVPGVTIDTDQTTTQDLTLSALPRFTLSGQVSRAESGDPIPGVPVRALGTPVPAAITDQAGSYALVLPLGTYTVVAGEAGCLSTDTAEIELFGQQVHDFGLVQVIDDFGHGCAKIPFDWVDAGSPTTLYGDDITGRLPLPFEFPFYDVAYDDVFVTTNGYLSFTDEFFGFSDAFSVPIPSTAPPNAAIFALWQDLWVVPDDARVEHDPLTDGSREGLVIEYANVPNLGEESGAHFEIKLWDDGTIDLLYGSGMAAVDNGGSASIGIEDESGSTGLQIGFRQDIFTDGTAYRVARVPTGFVAGTITDLNDGLPLAGATVTAQPGGRTATTDAEGRYELRLVPGSYEVTASARDYESATASVDIEADATVTRDFALAAPAALVDPDQLEASVALGETTTATVTVSNTGSAPLVWEARERDLGGTPPDLEPRPESTIVHPATWGGLGTDGNGGFDLTAEPTFDGPLDVIIDDPAGDAAGSVDVITVLGGASDVEVSIQIDLTGDSPLDQLGGYVFLDTDQDPATGLPAEALAGLPTQDVGMEYFVDLFGAAFGVGFLVDANTFELIAEIPVENLGSGVRFDLPLELLGGDDGSIDVALVAGDQMEPTDWAPDEGHGTVEPFRDAPWMTVAPTSGEVSPGESAEVEVTLGGPEIEPGDYLGTLAFVTNDPRRPVHEVAVALTVELPSDFGSVTGTITNARVGFPVPAAVEIHAERDGAPFEIVEHAGDVDGTYRAFGPAGTWAVDVGLEGYAPFSGEVTIAAGEETVFDVALDPLWPDATLDGGPIAMDLAPGESGTATLELGNATGLADLNFEVFELDRGGTEPAAPAVTPPGGVATEGSSRTRGAAGASQAVERTVNQGADAVVFMDALPWESEALLEVLDAAGAVYDVVGSEDMASLDLSGYRVVFVSNDQPQAFYDAYLASADRFSEYVSSGGLLWFGAASSGWNGGMLGDAPLPGDVTVVSDVFEELNDVALADHPVVAGVPNPFTGNFASHAGFTGVAEGSVIATGSESGMPTLVEYDVGAGRVLAFGQPMEWGWTNGEDSGLILANSVPYALAFQPFTDLPWLAIEPAEGTVAAGESSELVVSVDATDLDPGTYEAEIVVVTDDPANRRLGTGVTLTVLAG